jgi:threonine dehydratase
VTSPDPFPILRDVLSARKRQRGLIRVTPLVPDPDLSSLAGAPVWLKLENAQVTGTFKARGALTKILSLSPERRAKGVIAFSTGNHGRAVAAISRDLGIPAVICLSERVPQWRILSMQALGAEVVAYGEGQDQAFQKALEIERERDLAMIPPFDDPEILCGQGVLALEILEELPETAQIVVPLSGGGLFAGTALAAKSVNPAIKMIGVSMETGPAMILSLEAGRPVNVPEGETLADALLGGIGLDNRYTFAMTKRYIEAGVLVSEEEIAAGMVWAFQKHRQVVEGSGAVGLAALLAGKIKGPGPIVLVVSGGNADPATLAALALKSLP